VEIKERAPLRRDPRCIRGGSTPEDEDAIAPYEHIVQKRGRHGQRTTGIDDREVRLLTRVRESFPREVGSRLIVARVADENALGWALGRPRVPW